MKRSADDERKTSLERRRVLAGTFGLGALWLLACGEAGDDGQGGDGSGSSSGGSGAGGSSGTNTGSSGSVDASGWATGSGAYLDGKDYGNPFVGDDSASCPVFVAATEGPCHSNTYLRKDLSDGLVGLPTRIEFRVVGSDCAPIADAVVEIWYASPAGTYSRAAQEVDADPDYQGSASDLNVGFCTGNDSEALASNWLRAFQRTDADGRVQFDGIFPGWYSGRTPHIHFTVQVAGRRSFTSQTVFDEALTTAIYTQHGAYKARGDKDTRNATDNVVGRGGLSVEMATMGHELQSDGALRVWKTVAVSG